MIVPRDIQILIPGTCECYFTWKGDFTDAIIVRILRWEDDPKLLRWALNVINKKDPYKKDTERDLSTEERKCDVTTESEGEKAMSYRKGSLAKESSRWSPENRKDKRGDCSSEPPKEPSLTTP